MYHPRFLGDDRRPVQSVPPHPSFNPSVPHSSTSRHSRPLSLQPHEWQLSDAYFDHGFAGPTSYTPSGAQPQLYLPNNYGLPVNLSHGAVATESRGIHISNLSYNAGWKDLKDYMRSAGRVMRCDVPQGPNGKPKGHATVLFETPEEAKKACDIFDGAHFMGRPMRVKIDKVAVRKDPVRGGGAVDGGDGGGEMNVRH